MLAAAAMHAMNGRQIGSKAIGVRLHEPKQLRQEKRCGEEKEKVVARFGGHNGHPRSVSGATSPTPSEGGSYVGWSSPPTATSPLGGSPHPTPSVAGFGDKTDRGRRGSGSYYNVSTIRALCSADEAYEDGQGGAFRSTQFADEV